MRSLITANKLHLFRGNFDAAGKKLFPSQNVKRFSFDACTNFKLLRERFCRTDFNISRSFRTSERRNIPPVLLVVLRPLSKFGAALIGRGIRKWWQSLPPNKRLFVREKVRAQRSKIMIGTILLGGGAVAFYVSHLEETPISKRTRFVLFGPELYDSLSKDMFDMQQSMHQNSILPLSHPTYKFVGSVTDRLLLGNKDLKQIYSKSWSITVIDNPQPNAFVLPSGQIFVYTGMLKICENPDQLACILGHEMAHAVLGHSAEVLSHTQLIDVGMMVVLAIIWAVLPTDLTSVVVHWLTTKISALLLELPYNRMLETEADEVGLHLAAKACFDIRQSSVFWHKMSALQDQDDTDLEWLSTHPIHESRADFLDKIIPEAIELRSTHKCPPLPKKDPRADIEAFKEWAKNEQKKERDNVALVLKLPPKRIIKGST